jgi:hypothetical protein
MSDLDAAIRAKMAADDGRYADEIWWDAYRDAILAVLDQHRPIPSDVSTTGNVICSCLPDSGNHYIAEKLGVEAGGG